MSSKQVKIKKKGNLERRFEAISPEELVLRWQAMRPRYYRWIGLFASLACLLFLVNRALLMTYTVEQIKATAWMTSSIGIMNVAFQISCIFCVMFACLIGMSFWFGRTPAKQAA